jgi:predicted transcriptional regulator of viral defense system
MQYENFEKHFRPSWIINSSLLLPFYESAQQAQRQLSDWARAGKLLQLRRGVYAFSPPYKNEQPHRYHIANQLVRSSYVSLETALSYYDLIPEHVASVTSVTTGRPQKLSNAFGRFTYRHIQTRFFYGFRHWRVSDQQHAFLASPEKALLDLIYLTPAGDEKTYLRALRLQNLDLLNIEHLQKLVEEAKMSKLDRALKHLLMLVEEETQAYVRL